VHFGGLVSWISYWKCTE